uniref:Uncharacterized protein n=1 Tax=Chrysotila carterae TaxID=13221 RepID=A0A6T0ACQ4_CHRCT
MQRERTAFTSDHGVATNACRLATYLQSDPAFRPPHCHASVHASCPENVHASRHANVHTFQSTSHIHAPPAPVSCVHCLRLACMCFLRTALANKRTHTQTQTQTHALTHAHARTHARIAEVIKNKGEAQLTTEQLTQEIMPKGRGARLIPHFVTCE